MNLPDEVRELIKEEVQKNFERIREEVISEIRKMFEKKEVNLYSFAKIDEIKKEKILSDDEILFRFKLSMGFLEKIMYLNLFSDETEKLLEKYIGKNTLVEICKYLETVGVLRMFETKNGLKYVVFLTRDYEGIARKIDIDELRKIIEIIGFLIQIRNELVFDFDRLMKMAIVSVDDEGDKFFIILEGGKTFYVSKDPKRAIVDFRRNFINLNVGLEEMNTLIGYLEILSKKDEIDEYNEFLSYWVNEIVRFRRVESISKIKLSPLDSLFVDRSRVFISTDVERRIKKYMVINTKPSRIFKRAGITQLETMSVAGSYVRVFERKSLESFIRKFYPDFSFDKLPKLKESEIIEPYQPDEIEREIGGSNEEHSD